MTPPGTRLPNFFLAGAPKTGTTSLYAYVRQHPGVYMSWPKEPAFFGAADILTEPYFDAAFRRAARERDVLWAAWKGTQVPGRRALIVDWEDYVALFQNVRDETAIGEATVDYFWLPSAAQAIHAKVPAARLLFMLRDPAERLFSEYLARFWRHPQRRTFRAEFLAAVDRPDPWSRLRVTVGQYASHLQRFTEIFPSSQIRIHLFEDYRAHPRAVLRDIFEFLGVQPDHTIDLALRHNETVVPRFPTLHVLRRRLFGDTSPIRWLPEGARRVLQRMYRGRREDIAMDSADRRLLIEYYEDEIRRTAALLGRDLSAWLQ